MGLRPLTTQNSQGQNYGQLNDMIRQIVREQVTKIFKDGTGKETIIGKLPSGEHGLSLTDGTVTTTITAKRITQNDGTNDRLLMGDEDV